MFERDPEGVISPAVPAQESTRRRPAKLNDCSELLKGADTLFAAVIKGKLHVPINHAYALKDAAEAHIDLEGRATTGAAILKP